VAPFTIDRIPIPTSLDGAQGDDFRASVAVRNACEVRQYGTPEVAVPGEQLFPYWQGEHEPKVLWVARQGGAIVGRGVHETVVGEGSEIGWIDVDVHPDAEGAGIGTALTDAVEAYARGLGQTRLISYAPALDGPGDRLPSPTGFGSLPAATRGVRFHLARGYRLEQVERASRFALPADLADLRRRQSTAREAAGDDYRVHTWVGRSADRWVPDLADLVTRMTTDAPTAGLEEPEDVWTAERFAERDDAEAASGSVAVTAAVEHLPTGRLVGFTKMLAPDDTAQPVNQFDTLVVEAHRGHRLGMLLKVANLLQLESELPGHPSVLTWNAEENRAMLDVNEAVGFVPIGYEGAWRLDL
jgi:GNAT superfamily N-acetyltransferase